MFKKMILIALFVPVTTASFSQTPEFPVSVAFTIQEKDLVPEGITYDPVTHQFFISSINKKKVVAIDEKGIVRDFLRPGQDGILQTLGMKVDAQKRRFWVVSNDGSASFVHVFDIASGGLIKKFRLEKDSVHLFNDIALTGNGDAFITDTYSDVIYTVPADLTGLSPFIESDAMLKWANGLTVSPDNKILYVATGGGIIMINIKTLAVKPIVNPGNISTSGIDGLVFYGGSLIGVVNSKDDDSEMYIAKYKLSPDLEEITGMSIIDKGNPVFNLPTTCVIAEDYLYCLANTSLRLYFHGKTDSKEKFQNPVILRYKITE
jgi:hypothetical protein